jgi:hypothetical protein
VRLPERDLAESILHLAAPLLDPLGPTPPIDEARRAIEAAINLWNAHVTASKFWGDPRPKPLADLRKAMSGDGEMFTRLAERWRQEFAFDPRLVGEWSYESTEGGQPRLVCEMTLPEGVEAAVPPPAEKRVAIGGSFLDEVRIRQGASSYLLFPVEHHRGVVGDDGVATIYAKMPSVLQMFADGRLPAIDGPPVEITIGVKKLGPMVLRELHCAGGLAHDVAVLVFRPTSSGVTG